MKPRRDVESSAPFNQFAFAVLLKLFFVCLAEQQPRHHSDSKRCKDCESCDEVSGRHIEMVFIHQFYINYKFIV